MQEGSNQSAQDLEGQTEKENTRIMKIQPKNWTKLTLFLDLFFTLFLVCVWPMRIRALEEMMERQKLMRMTERSDRMYL